MGRWQHNRCSLQAPLAIFLRNGRRSEMSSSMSFLIPVAGKHSGEARSQQRDGYAALLRANRACGGKSIQGRAPREDDGSAHTLSRHAARARPI